MIMRKKYHIQHASNDWKSIQVKKGVSHSEDIKVVIATSNHIDADFSFHESKYFIANVTKSLNIWYFPLITIIRLYISTFPRFN